MSSVLLLALLLTFARRRNLLLQSEVEQYFVKEGYLLPKYHQGYWLGLRAAQWPTFQWIDVTAGQSNYKHWGQLPDGSYEPKHRLNTCGAGNYSLLDLSAWGWSGENCNRALPYMCRILKPGNITIPSNITGNVFTLMSIKVNHAKAEALCNDIGGHLTAYASQEEQTEMEFAFLASGHLLPSFHKNYWIGLTSTLDAWPAFSWLDRNVAPPEQGYSHWGTFRLEGFSTPEPNNGNYPELCAVANHSQAYGSPAAWGWADVPCAFEAAVVCRRLREWPRLRLFLLPSVLADCLLLAANALLESPQSRGLLYRVLIFLPPCLQPSSPTTSTAPASGTSTTLSL